jgi:hypothetical protein
VTLYVPTITLKGWRGLAQLAPERMFGQMRMQTFPFNKIALNQCGGPWSNLLVTPLAVAVKVLTAAGVGLGAVLVIVLV